MNRVGMVVDMSHSGEKSTFDAIDISERPITITHANSNSWHPALRNKSTELMKALGDSGGFLGFSMYPFHLKNGSNCSIREFCEMIAGAVETMGIDNVGIGSDLVQGHGNEVVEWMRNGRWSKDTDFGEGSVANAGWPEPVSWFTGNRDFKNISNGLSVSGFSDQEVAQIMGLNWLRFFESSFEPQ
jgi:microsomal dipeptidase-like Zn-dependent dipeptidase